MQETNQLKESPSQTAGPYVHIGCMPNFCNVTGVYPEDLGTTMVSASTKGPRIMIRGTVFDGTETPLKDAMIEIWQADADGRYSNGDPRGSGDSAFLGWGRTAGDYRTGEWVFETIKPGAVPFPDGRMMAPHVTLWIVARGINLGLHTRMYFPDEEAANAADPILARLELETRVSTLIGVAEGDGAYRFDIHLQGANETVFFDV